MTVVENALVANGVETAVAKRVAAQQAPSPQNQPAKYAVLSDRLRGVGRTGRLVLAPAWDRGRDKALVGDDRKARYTADQG